jgi:hypothetical protein
MLKVSKPIECDYITDYPQETRFLKLPVANYLKLCRSPGNTLVWDELNRPQVALINALNDPRYRFIVAALSRRLGKTFIANVCGQLVSLIPGCNVLIMSPNYNLSGISFELQRYFIRQFDLEVLRDNQKDKVIELSNHSTIRMGSVTTVDSCVGRSYDLIIFDEAALCEGGDSAFNVSLRPTLDKLGSKAIFISTPRGKNNWFSKFWDRGWSVDYPQWISLHADWTENHRMLQSDVEEASSSMTRSEFEQEYLASFSVFEGQIFSFEEGMVVPWEPVDGVEMLAGIDVGYRDPTAMVVVAYNQTTGIFHVVAEYLEREATTEAHARSFRELIDRWGLDTIFIDSAAAQFSSDLAYLYDISTIKAKKDVLPGVAYVQNVIETGRLRVDPSCTHTVEMLQQYRWDTKANLTKEKPLHDRYSHMADALRYCLYSWTL